MDEIFKYGDHVQLVQRPTAPKEADDLVGKHGWFLGYSKTQRYAVVSFAGVEPTTACLIHPENLQPSSPLVQVIREALILMPLYGTRVILGVCVKKADHNLFESASWTEPYDVDKAAEILAN